MQIKSIKKSNFPQELQEINDPPDILYYRGNIEVLKHKPAIAIVGTRRCSDYGKEATRKIAGDLAKSGITIISGMARGIDTLAHEAALEYGAPTIAVLGSPVNDGELYPKRNIKLARRIIEAGGLILSEYPEGTPSYPANFPKRNRIVAGLSQGVLIAESPIKGGSMITARLALDYNRDVYAIPGSIFSRFSEGPNFWIKSGAKSVSTGYDIIEDLAVGQKISLKENTQKESNLSEEEKLTLDAIKESSEAIHIDKITKETKLNTEKTAEVIASLLLEGYISEAEPNYYIAI